MSKFKQALVTEMTTLAKIVKNEDVLGAIEYAEKLNFKNVPEEIVEVINSFHGSAFTYAEKLDWKNVPKETLNVIIKHGSPYQLGQYLENMGYENSTPEIVKAICIAPVSNPRHCPALDYAVGVKFKNVPEEIVNRISTDPHISYIYKILAEEHGEVVPNKINESAKKRIED